MSKELFNQIQNKFKELDSLIDQIKEDNTQFIFIVNHWCNELRMKTINKTREQELTEKNDLDYLVESWVNGNRKHVIKHLIEMPLGCVISFIQLYQVHPMYNDDDLNIIRNLLTNYQDCPEKWYQID